MTFEEAGAQFAQLRQQYLAGMIQPAQFQQMVAQLSVQDQSGCWWQLEPNSGQWLMWNGTQWTWPQAVTQQPTPTVASQPAAVPAYAVQQNHPAYTAQPAQYAAVPQSAPQATLTVQKKPAAPAIWEGLAPVLPGFVIGIAQGWPMYSKNAAMLAGFAIPSLLPAILVPLVPYIGRVVAIILVVGCLVWLSWPVFMQLSSILGNAQAVQANAGRGLVGLSLVYLIPRIWKIK